MKHHKSQILGPGKHLSSILHPICAATDLPPRTHLLPPTCRGQQKHSSCEIPPSPTCIPPTPASRDPKSVRTLFTVRPSCPRCQGCGHQREHALSVERSAVGEHWLAYVVRRTVHSRCVVVYTSALSSESPDLLRVLSRVSRTCKTVQYRKEVNTDCRVCSRVEKNSSHPATSTAKFSRSPRIL